MMLATAILSALASTPTEAAAIAAAQSDHSAYVLGPEALAKASALYHFRMLSYLASTFWGVLSLYAMLRLHVVARLRDFAVRHARGRWSQGAHFLLGFLALSWLLTLPLGVLGEHVQHRYGLSVQPWTGWLADQLKALAIVFVLGDLVMMLAFWVVRRSPRLWWMWMSCVVVALSVLSIFLVPYVIDPIFNHFDPLGKTNPALVEQLERVVARGNGIHIPPERMFLMHASEKTSTLNAYVTGFGASKRVVVWDTSIQKCTPEQILFIFGHEMGHYVLGHIVRGVLISIPLTFIALFLGFHAFQWLLRTEGPRWGIPSQNDWGAVPVFVLVLTVFSFFGEPVGNAFSRVDEHEADVYGQEVVHGIVANPQQAAQSAFQRLGETGYAYPYPSPLYVFWTASHPPTWFRAAFARHYDPWTPGASPRYLPPAESTIAP